ncbi:hypothetical protein ACLMJK_004830 [Lecanora helva]
MTLVQAVYGLLTSNVLFCFTCYLVALAIYRLYFTAVAEFPGPKLAALTKWYEFYFDVVLQGKFIFKVRELHRQYGPIIRITPDELHVEDPEFLDELYSRSERRDKYESTSNRFGNPTSILGTSSHELHRVRRTPLNPLFSKKEVNEKFVPVIWRKLDLLCTRFAQFQAEGRILPLNQAWSAFCGDMMSQLTFGKTYNHLASQEFQADFHDGFVAAAKLGPAALQFPWIMPLMQAIPAFLVVKVQPLLAILLEVQRDINIATKEIIDGKSDKENHFNQPTVVQTLLDSDIPPQEKSLSRLRDEAQLIIAAGLKSTAWALTIASFHIINTPETFIKLRKELESAMSNPDAEVELTALEKLPYLHACTQEAVRLSYGVTTRLPRILPHDKLRYGTFTIPAGTPVSMTIPDVHHDEAIFPNSHTFIPERWMGNPRTPNGSPLDRYLIAYGKGSRSCLGINLAQAMLHMGLAKTFRRFSFELHETDVSDVAMAHDLFMPLPKMDSKGVRVKVVTDALGLN